MFGSLISAGMKAASAYKAQGLVGSSNQQQGGNPAIEGLTNRVTALESAGSAGTTAGVDPGVVNPGVRVDDTSYIPQELQQMPTDSTNPRLMSQSPEAMKGVFGEQVSGSFDRTMPAKPNLENSVANPTSII